MSTSSAPTCASVCCLAGSGGCSFVEKEERLLTNRSNQSRDNERPTMISMLEPDVLQNQLWGLVPRYPLQKPPSRGLEGSGGEGGGGGRRSEGRRGLHLRRGLQGGLKGA